MKRMFLFFVLLLSSFAVFSAEFQSEATWKHGVGCENVCTYTLYEIDTGDVNTFTKAAVIGNDIAGTQYSFTSVGEIGETKYYVLYAVLAQQVSAPSNVASKVLPVTPPTNFEIRVVRIIKVTVTEQGGTVTQP